MNNGCGCVLPMKSFTTTSLKSVCWPKPPNEKPVVFEAGSVPKPKQPKPALVATAGWLALKEKPLVPVAAWGAEAPKPLPNEAETGAEDDGAAPNPCWPWEAAPKPLLDDDPNVEDEDAPNPC